MGRDVNILDNDPESQSLYCQLPHIALRIATDQWIVWSTDSERVCVLDDLSLRALMQCHGARSIDDHLLHAVATLRTEDTAKIRRLLQNLAACRLLYRIDLRRIQETSRNQRRMMRAKVGIITADRPRRLRLCVASLIRHCEKFGAVPDIIVVDGSIEESNRDHNRAFVGKMQAGIGSRVRYVSRPEIVRISRALANTGLDQSIIEFGLLGGTGANRNALSLLTAGESLVTFDDDIVCTPWTLAEAGDAIVLGGHEDCHEVSFFDSRDAALTGLQPSDANIIEAHSQLVGQRLTDIVARGTSSLDIRDACSHLLLWLHKGETKVVRLTFSGLAGDSGGGCPYPMLLGSAPVQRHIFQDRIAFMRAVSSREIRRIARSTTVTDNPWCMMGCTGLYNQELLPPFMPLGRAQDWVFGAILAYIDRGSLSAHLPIGIIHDSDRPSAYSQAFRSAAHTELCDFVVAALQGGCADNPSRTSRDERMRYLGRIYSELGASTPRDFAAFSMRAALDRRCKAISNVDVQSRDTPSYWREAIAKYREAFIESTADARFFVASEVGSGLPLEERKERLRMFIGQFGRLLSTWPDIVSAFRQLTLGRSEDDTFSPY